MTTISGSMRMAVIAAIAVCSLHWQPATAQQASPEIGADLGGRLASEVIQPIVADFSRSAELLSGSIDALCDGPDARRLSNARERFAATVQAWGQLSILRFGPLVADNRFERIFFWPDARGVTLRQVQDMLARKDETALSPDGMKDKSVALQGLPALEFVLHGSGADELALQAGSYRCRYGRAISANLSEIAAEIEEDWGATTDFAISFAQPSQDGNPYRSPQEVAGEIVKALGTGLQFISNAQIKPALGETFDDANGNRAPFRRADLTFALIRSQLEGMLKLLAGTGWRDAAEGDVATAADGIAFDLERVGESIASIGSPAAEAFEIEQEWGKLHYVTVALGFANQTVGEKLAVALGLTMGFNALDGD